MFDITSFGKTIRELRKKRGLTLVRVAMDINIYHTYLSQIECGERIPSADVAVSLANYYRISFDNIPVTDYQCNVIIHEINRKINRFDSVECKFLYKTILKIISK